MEEIQDLSKQIDFSNLTYHYKGKNDPNNFIGFKGPLKFYRSITLEKAEEQQKEYKSNINEIIITSKKSENQISEMKNIKILYKSPENIIQVCNDYSRILSVAKCRRRKHREGLKILTPKQMLQRLPVAVAQVKAGNALNLLNEIRQIIYSLYQEKEVTKKM